MVDLRQFEQKITDPFLKAAIELGRKEIPGFTIKFKKQSLLMWLVNRFARLFNPAFMTRFHTTMGNTWYLISEERALTFQRGLVNTVFHEITHMRDRKEHGFITYNLSYLFPQILALLAAPLIVLAALLVIVMPTRVTAWIGLVVGVLIACILWSAFVSPWMLLFLLPGLALIPFPSPGRTKWERRGYAMSAAVEYWMSGQIIGRAPERMQKHFTGWNYYRMCSNEDKVLGFLREDVAAIESGQIKQDSWFRKVYILILGEKINVGTGTSQSK